MVVGRIPSKKNIIEEGTVKFLNDVRRYGTLVARYNLDEGSGKHTDTESVFIYRYISEPTQLEYSVVIVMSRGEYIDYYKSIV